MNKIFPKKTKANSLDNVSTNSNSTSKDNLICRICQTEKEPPEFLRKKNKKINNEDFTELINPCLCRGSMKYVHRECLQHWIYSSKAKKCELCLYPFKIKIRSKKLTQWQFLPLTSLEQKRIFFTVLFQVMAMSCAIWSLGVLINKTVEEILSFKLSWSLWIKLLVIALGLTGLSLFMWIQIRLYLTLFIKWRAHNQEHIVMSPSDKELEEARRERTKTFSMTYENNFIEPVGNSNVFRKSQKLSGDRRNEEQEPLANLQSQVFEQQIDQQNQSSQHFTDSPSQEIQNIPIENGQSSIYSDENIN